jgi:hypothetical protein
MLRSKYILIMIGGLVFQGCNEGGGVREIIRETTIIREVPAESKSESKESKDKQNNSNKFSPASDQELSITAEIEDFASVNVTVEELGEAHLYEDYQVNYVHVDLADAIAFVTLEDSQNILSLNQPLSQRLLDNASSQNASAPLFKLLPNTSAAIGIRVFKNEKEESFKDSTVGSEFNDFINLPPIAQIAINQCREVFIAFEYPFMFRDRVKVNNEVIKIKNYPNSNNSKSPFTCDFFKVKQTLDEYKSGVHDIQVSNLECISPALELELNNVKTGNRTRDHIQFDGNCNLFFVAHLATSSYNNQRNNLIIKRDALTGELSESTNQRICFNDYEVTQNSSILYTGFTNIDGNNCTHNDEKDIFLRHVSPLGSLSEISKGSEFIYHPIEAGRYEGQVVYYGAHPLGNNNTDPWGHNGWNEYWHPTCLFRSDPYTEDNTGTPTIHESTTELAACHYDRWSYTSEWNNPTLSNRDLINRCKHETYFLGNGTSCWWGCSERTTDIKIADLTHDGEDDIVTLGDMRYKPPGIPRCSVCLDVGVDHCVDQNNNLKYIGACTGSGKTNGTWAYSQWRNQFCYWGIENEGLCADETPIPGVTIDSIYCDYDWRLYSNIDEYISGVGLVLEDKTIKLLSDKSHQIEQTFLVNNQTYYSTNYGGTYYLNAIEINTTGEPTVRAILRDTEVYHLSSDPMHSERLVVAGLYFPTNKFFFGYVNPQADNPQATLVMLPNMTGVVDSFINLTQ